MKFFWLIPIGASQLARVVAYATAIAVVFCYLLARYWSFYHLGVGGGFVFTLIVPAAVITSIVLGIAATFALLWRRVPAHRAVRLSVALIALIAIAILASQIHRSHDARSGEGAGAGDLAPFFRSLITLR
jgi:putative flippase GtrA